METGKTSKEIFEKWHKDPSNWVCWGMFYYNKQDKRIFPPKRIKSLGWTLNFANPLSLLIGGGLLALLIVLLVWIGNPKVD